MSNLQEIRIRQINTELDRLDKERFALLKEKNDLLLARSKTQHSCSCVRLNRDINITNIGDQIRANRRGLGLGLVAETLSADCGCPFCKGTGIPQNGEVVHE
jgi:hypothetical protein